MPTVWLTQSTPSVDVLAEALRPSHANVCALPIMQAIKQCDLVDAVLANKVSACDTLLFTSGHAIRFWHQRFPHWPRSQTQQYVAMGPSTAAQMAQFGYHPIVHLEAAQSGSEALLRQLRSWPQQRFAVITGQQRRGVLEQQLSARGHDVCCVPLYRMDPIAAHVLRWHTALQPGDVTVMASAWTQQCLQAAMHAHLDLALLQACHWVVVSERLGASWSQMHPTLPITVASSTAPCDMVIALKACGISF